MVTTQKTSGKRSQTVLAPAPESEFSSDFGEITSFDPDYDSDELEPQDLSDLDDTSFVDYASFGVEEINLLQTEAESDSELSQLDDPAQAEIGESDPEDNYDDYIPDEMALEDGSEFEDYRPASPGKTAVEPESETDSEFVDCDPDLTEADESEFKHNPLTITDHNQFEDIDDYDYQPETESELESSEDADPDSEDENEDDEDLIESGYEASEEEEETEEFIDPRTAKSKAALTGNPLVKAAFIGAAGLIVVMIGGSIYSLLSGGGTKPDQAAANLEEVTPEPEASAMPEEGRLRAELAFSAQQNDLERARRLNSPQPSPSPSPSPSPKTAARPVAVTGSAPLPQPLLPPQPLPNPGLVSAVPVAPPPVDPYADLSPIERWQAIATMGSFGRANPNARPAAAAAPAAMPAARPAMSAAVPTAMPASAPTAASGNGLTQLRASSGTPGLRSAPLADVLVGTTAQGSLATAVILGADSPEAANPNSPTATKYLVNLNSPIKDAQGQTAIPAGATLVVVVSGFSAQTGTMQLAVKSVIHNNREYQAPEGAILIRGEDGASLRASRIGGNNPIVATVLPSLLQGAATAAGTLTQNRGTTVTNGSVTTTTNSGEANIAAGFVQGAGQSLAQQISQATQNANAAAQSRPQSWRLSEGKEVQIFVNSTFQM